MTDPADAIVGWRLPSAPALITIAGSAGAIAAVRTILRHLPDDLPVATVVLIHRPAHGESYLVDVLRRCTHMPVVTARDGERIVPGVVYVAAPDRHLVIGPGGHFAYHDGRKIKFVRSAANPLLESAARAFDGRLVAVVLTGGGSDATDGVQAVKAHGGVVIAQDLATSEVWSMPESAIRTGAVDHVLPLSAIAPALAAIVRGEPFPVIT